MNVQLVPWQQDLVAGAATGLAAGIAYYRIHARFSTKDRTGLMDNMGVGVLVGALVACFQIGARSWLQVIVETLTVVFAGNVLGVRLRGDVSNELAEYEDVAERLAAIR